MAISAVRQNAAMAEEAPWNHNLHYRPLILSAVPNGCQRALDVGCGKGELTRELRRRVTHVAGIDADRRSIELARSHPGAGDINYVLGDFLTFPFEPNSFDLITSVASLHHMDVAAALRRMADLLRQGGVLAVIGLARGSSLTDLALNVPAAVVTRVHHIPAMTRRKPRETYLSPRIWPPSETFESLRRVAQETLPGVRHRRLLLWRYALTWVKPR